MSNTNSNDDYVLDTFKISANGIFLKEFHLERTLAAIRIYSKNFTLKTLTEIYNKIENDFNQPTSCVGRLAFDTKKLATTFETQIFTETLEPVILEISKGLTRPSGVGKQNYKWLDRADWDQVLSLKSKEVHDVLTLNDLNNVIETSRFNLFFYSTAINQVFTPPLTSGCVAGTYRAWALQNEKISLPQLGAKSLHELDITIDQIKNYQLFVANSVRGVLSAKLFC